MSNRDPNFWLVEGMPVIWKKEVFIFLGDSPEGDALIWGPSLGRETRVHKADLRPLNDSQYSSNRLKDLEGYPGPKQATALRRQEVITSFLSGTKGKRELQLAADELGVSPLQVTRYIENYLVSGMRTTALIPHVKIFGNQFNKISSAQQEVLDEVIRKEYLNDQKVRASVIIKSVNRECKDRAVEAISESTIRRAIKKLPPGEAVLLREGKKAARYMYGLHRGKSPIPDRPLSRIQIDHTPLNVFVLLPNGTKKRPWITVAIDVYTRMVVGFYLSINRPSTLSVGLCLFRVMSPRDEWLHEFGIRTSWPCFGKPIFIQADNAMEFRGSGLASICMDHDIGMIFRPVGQPHWGAHIERMMSRISIQMEVLSGATFQSIALRGDYPSEDMAILTLSVLEKVLLHFFVQVYHHGKHEGLGGASPISRWTDYVSGTGAENQPVPPIQAGRALLISLLPSFERKIQQDGVQWDTYWYSDPILNDWVQQPNPDTGSRKFRFHWHPSYSKYIYWKHPDSGLWFQIQQKDSGASNEAVCEREARRSSELEEAKSKVFPEVVEEGERSIHQIATDSRETALAAMKKGKHKRRPKRQAPAANQGSTQSAGQNISETLKGMLGAPPSTPEYIPEEAFASIPIFEIGDL